MFDRIKKDTVRLLVLGVLALGLILLRPNLTAGPITVVKAEGVQSAQDAAHAVPNDDPYPDSTQCTYRAWQLAAQAGHKLPWFAGDATDWRQGALDDGLRVVDQLDPSVVNSVAVWHAGVGGAGDAGHVAWVTAVQSNQFQVQERNWNNPGADDTRWVQWEPGISFIVFSAQPSDLRVTQPPAIDQPHPHTKEGVHVHFSVKNVGQSPITLQEMTASVRQGSDWASEPRDFDSVKDITLQPGQECTYHATRSFSQSGDYVVQVMIKMQGYGWVPVNDAGGNTPRLSFNLQQQSTALSTDAVSRPQNPAQAVPLPLYADSLSASGDVLTQHIALAPGHHHS